MDQLVTSPHIPKQDGQIGYCSKKIIPNLSCTGIRSELEEQPLPVTTADGKMTKIFVLTAYRTMRDLQRGIVVQNAKEEIFKLDHRQYIDKLLVDMEASKRDKHQRRMRHWKKEKNAIGFSGSFESAFVDSTSKWQPVDTEINAVKTPDYDFDQSSGNISPFQFAGETPASPVNEYDRDQQGIANEVSRSQLRVRIVEANEAQLRRVNSSDDHSLQSSQSSRVSQGSAGANGFSRKDDLKRIKTHSRMALFNSLLDVVEPPKSPVKRFGTVSSQGSASGRGLTMSPLDNAGSSAKFGSSKGMGSKGAGSNSASGKGPGNQGLVKADSNDSFGFGVADSTKLLAASDKRK